MFRLYGPHGYRSFNARAVKAMFDLFADFSHTSLYALGGPACARVQYDYVQDGLDLVEQRRPMDEPEAYVDALNRAIREDAALPQIPIREACFLAMVIHSYPRNTIFNNASMT